MGQRVLCGSLTVILLALGAFAAVSVAKFKFGHLFHNHEPSEVRLGLLFDEHQPFEQRLKQVALAAIEDINAHIKGLFYMVILRQNATTNK